MMDVQKSDALFAQMRENQAGQNHTAEAAGCERLRQLLEAAEQANAALQDERASLLEDVRSARMLQVSMQYELDRALGSTSYRLGHKAVSLVKKTHMDKPLRWLAHTLRKMKGRLCRGRSADRAVPKTDDDKMLRLNNASQNGWDAVRCDQPINVVVYGDMDGLDKTLSSLKQQTHLHWELYVIGSGSTARFEQAAGKPCCVIPFSQDVLRKIGGAILAVFHPVALVPQALDHFAQSIADGASSAYSDRLMVKAAGVMQQGPILAPDYAPDYLRSTNYFGGVIAFSQAAAAEVYLKPFTQSYARAYDLALQAQAPMHIRLLLYTELGCGLNSESSDQSIQALEAHVCRLGWNAAVQAGSTWDSFRVRQAVEGKPMVSIVIPNKDHTDLLSQCVESIKKSTYDHYEVIVVENNSTQSETFAYYDMMQQDGRFRTVVYRDPGPFNISKINNFGVENAHGDYIVLMNNDIEITTNGWMEIMLGFAQRKDVGVVGAKLVYPDRTIQHGGMVLLKAGWATHAHWHFPDNAYGYGGRLVTDQNYHAVTTACAMLPRTVYQEIRGFSQELAEGYTDVDLCMKARDKGYLVIWAAGASLTHYESVTRGQDDTPEKHQRAVNEIRYFQEHWRCYYKHGDMYYSLLFKEGNDTFQTNWECL